MVSYINLFILKILFKLKNNKTLKNYNKREFY